MSIRLTCRHLVALALVSLCCLAAAAPRPTHVEATAIGKGSEAKFESLGTFCLDSAGNILACDEESKCVLKVSPSTGAVLAKWRIAEGAPEAICTGAGETVYVATPERLMKLDRAGKVVTSQKDFKLEGVTSIDADGPYIFVSGRKGFSYGVVRLSADLAKPKLVIKGLRGCCGQMDFVARDGVIYVAENGRHRVVRYDVNGKMLGEWGTYDRSGVNGFGSCCNPMNVCFGPDGMLYTSESLSPGLVKRFTPDGKYLGLVGRVGSDGGCVDVTVRVSADGKRVYVADGKEGIIRVLKQKP